MKTSMADGAAPPTDTDISRPQWFAAFLADRGTRKPSAHTIKAYRQDFDAIATLIAGGAAGDISRMSVASSTAFSACDETATVTTNYTLEPGVQEGETIGSPGPDQRTLVSRAWVRRGYESDPQDRFRSASSCRNRGIRPAPNS